MAADGTIKIYTDIDTKGLQAGTRQIETNMNRISGSVRKIGGMLASAFAVKQIVQFGKECLDLGSDLQEVQNVVDSVFTTMSDKVDKFARSAATSAGLSETMAKRYTGTFGAMAKAFGFTEEEAFGMAASLTQLSGDVASFYNLTQDEAYTKLKSVFTGETESLKDLGVVMTQAALDSYAMANGFGKTTSAMSEQEKVALRYQFVMDQLSTASGDFIRTSGGWANQVKILQLQIESLKATVGQGLINLFTPVIKVINLVLAKLATVANAFKAFTELITGNKSKGTTANSVTDGVSTGYDSASQSAEDYAKATDDAAKAMENAKKAAEGYLSPIDQINKFTSSENTSQVSGSSPAAGTAISAPAVDYGQLAKGETVIDEMNGSTQALIDKCRELAAAFKAGFVISFGDSETKIQSIKTSISGIGSTLKAIFTSPEVLSSADSMAKSIAGYFGQITGAAASIGLSLASNLFGGLENYLISDAGFIKQSIISIFDATADIANISGQYVTALSGLFNIFTTPTAKKITSDLIGLFVNGFLGVQTAGITFLSNMVTLVLTPVINNIDKIKLAFEGILEPISIVLSTLHTSMLTTFSVVSEVYTNHIEPFVTNFTNGISNIAGTLLDAWNKHISPVLTKLANKFKKTWQNTVQPLLNTIIGLVGDLADLFNVVWTEIIEPIITEFIDTSAPAVGGALENIGGWFTDLFGTVSTAANGILTALSGVITFLTGVFSQDWDTVTKGIEKITKGLQSTVESVFKFIRESILQPFDNFLSKIFEKDWTETFGILGSGVNGLLDIIETLWSSGKETLNDILDFLEDVFTGDWEDAWNTARSAMETAFEGLVELIKKPVNGVIALLNGLISAVNSLLELIESKLKFDFTIPNPLGGDALVDYHWQATLPRIYGSIPLLAQGAVIPPNAPFLAMLGDQKNGTNLEMPESLLRKVLREEMGSRSGGNTYNVQATCNRKTIFELMIEEAKLQQQITGQNPFALT